MVVLPDRNLDPDRRVDWIGAAIITLGLVLLQFSVSYAQDSPQGWKTGCECKRLKADVDPRER
jgi:hypothetical protein